MRQDETSECKSALSSSEVERRRKRKKDEKKHKCPKDECDAIFTKLSHLARHARCHTGERSYKCDHEGCKKAYMNAYHLKRHKETHSIHKRFKCPVCQLSISSKYNLKRHYKLMHSEEGKRLSCDECGEKFMKKYQLSTHKLQQHKEGECDHCEKKFTSAKALKRHRACHEEWSRQKRYRCSTEGCEAEFGKRLLLYAHAKTHRAVRPKCEICGKEFSRRVNLNIHRRKHEKEGEKVRCPYEGCDRVFVEKRNLYPHVRATHLGVRYECDVCSARYTSKARLRQHIECLHGEGVAHRQVHPI